MKNKIMSIIIFLTCIELFSQTFFINPIKQAEELYKDGRFEEALNILNTVVFQNPNDMYALMDRSCVYDALKKYDKALQDIEIVIKNEPFNLKARHFRGGIYENLGEHLKAIEDENYVLEKVPTFSSGYNVRGLAYGGLNLYEDSLNDFSAAITNALIKNEYAEPYYLNRAYTYYYLKRYNDSLSDIDMVIKLNNKNPEPFILKGQIFRVMGKYEDSINWVSQAIMLAPDYYEIYYLRVIDYLQTKQYDLAEKDLSFIQPKMSTYSAYHALMSIYYYLIDDKDNADKEYKTSLEISANEKNSFVIKILSNEFENFITNRKFDDIIFN